MYHTLNYKKINNNTRESNGIIESRRMSGGSIIFEKCETSPDELLHIKSSTASEPVIKLENTVDVTNGVNSFCNVTTGEGDNDIPGTIRFKGMNSANTETEFSTIYTRNIDVTDGTEDSEMEF